MFEDIELMMELATEMEAISEKYCLDTCCNDDRMKSANDEMNCKWYHAGWLYCRLAGIIISKDYLESQYRAFFLKKMDSERIDVLICGFADHALLMNIFATIPKPMVRKVHFTLIDICRSPIELCKLYVEKTCPSLADRLTYLQADATSIPIPDRSFDLITTYSFLTRMSKPLMQKVLDEWFRLLKPDGEVLTTVRITTDSSAEESFHRGSASSIAFGMDKIEAFLASHNVDSLYAGNMRKRAYEYLTNIMSSTLINTSITDFLDKYCYETWYYDQPGELEAVHKMMGLRVCKEAEG